MLPPVYYDLLARIVTGAAGFRPGDWLTVHSLAAQTGQSPDAIRFALAQLAHDGLVRRSHLGTQVCARSEAPGTPPAVVGECGGPDWRYVEHAAKVFRILANCGFA